MDYKTDTMLCVAHSFNKLLKRKAIVERVRLLLDSYDFLKYHI